MKKVFLLFMSVATLISCSDEGIEPKKQTTGECKVTEISAGTDKGKMKFEFDNQGRVIKVVDNMTTDYPTKNILTNVVYEKDKVTVTENYNGQEEWKTEYLIENNRITHMSTGDYMKIYQYNSEGYLTKITSEHTSSTSPDIVLTDIAYKDGNISFLKATYQNEEYIPVYNSSPRLAYTEHLADPFSEWFLVETGEAILYEQGLMGKKIKNQIVSVKDKYETETFSYTADNNVKPNSVTYNKSWGTKTFSFTFDCK